jgi:hypothetical protein
VSKRLGFAIPAITAAFSSLSKVAAEKASSNSKPFTYETPYQESVRLSEQKKRVKLEAMKFKPLVPLEPEKTLTSPAIIALSISGKELFTEEVTENLIESIDRTYQIPILRPLMDFVALACLGKASSIPSEKRFKIIATNLEDINPEYSEIVGVYTSRNTAFVSLQNLGKLSKEERKEAIDEFWSLSLHESTHFAMAQLFSSYAAPKVGSFVESLETILWNIEKLDPKENARSPHYAKMEGVRNYPKNQQAAELIARATEVILNDPKGGYEWLKTHTPELLTCFEEEINPLLVETLKKREASKYLDLSPMSRGVVVESAGKLLTKTKSPEEEKARLI